MGLQQVRRFRFFFGSLLTVLSAVIFISAGTTPSVKAGAANKSASDDPIANAWPVLSDVEQTAAVADIKGFAADATTRFTHPLNLTETKYFLFMSDLSPRETQKWASLLDKMYARLAELFAVREGENIWRGKALIFVFGAKADFAHFEHEMFHHDPGFAIGLCHELKSGVVIVSFCKQRDEMEFAHVLVHESVHGFIHRYRTSVHVPSWVNEGLAETIATELVPQAGRAEKAKVRARSGITGHGGQLDDFFTAMHIEPWQYPVAESLCAFMIAENKKGYVEFVKGIKDGTDSVECLGTRYKASRDRLLAAFGKKLGLKRLN